MFYPVASNEVCTAALLLDLDPSAPVLAEDHASTNVATSQGSLMAVALGGVFGTAMAGRCEARPKLAATAIPLVVHVPTPPDRRSGGRAAGRVPGARGERGDVPPGRAWHVDVADQLLAADPALFRRTERMAVDTSDAASTAAGVAWWEALTAAGGEGLVVNTAANLVPGPRVQPG